MKTNLFVLISDHYTVKIVLLAFDSSCVCIPINVFHKKRTSIYVERMKYLSTAGQDQSITRLSLPDLVTSGETVTFNLTLDAILIGEGSLSAPKAENFTMKLIKRDDDKGVGKDVGLSPYCVLLLV